MGEDRSTCTEKKPNGEVIAPPPCRHRHSSIISSCSEDAESTSTSAGYPASPDEERDEELEYGPGIVNKLRTRFLSITLKQNRGTNMKRSCSMENLLDHDGPTRAFPVTKVVNGGCVQSKPQWGNLKRAKSMDTLLMELQPEHDVKDLQINGCDDKKLPKVIKRRDDGLNRLVPTICDEELPKPDTVKTYKRMFEPAESRRGSHCRRPPVLRASAKSSAALKTNGVSSNPSAKVNGIPTKSKLSAKQFPPIKAQANTDVAPAVNGHVKKTNGEPSKPLFNGSTHIVKATPVKINTNSNRSVKDVEKNLNSINRILNKKEVHFSPKTDIISNGNGCLKDILKLKSSEEIVKQFNKNGCIIMNNIVNGKPKVPPNRPSLKSPKPLFKIDEQKSNSIKPKPHFTNGIKKPSEVDTNHEKTKIPETNSKESNKPQENKLKDKLKLSTADKCKEPESKSPEIKTVEEIKLPISEVTPKDPVKQSVENKSKESVKSPPENKVIVQKTNQSAIKDQKIPDPEIPERTMTKLSEQDKSSKPPCVPEKKTENISNEPLVSEKDKSLVIKQDKYVKRDAKAIKKSQATPGQTTSMVFDFRGKDVVSHVAVLPVPFGCKALHPKKRPALVDGQEVPNGTTTDDDDEEFVDYSVPLPSGVVFEGENVKIGRGSILSIRNKDLKISFTDDVDGNTFVYPSESSLLEEPERSLSPSTSGNEVIPNGQPPPSKLKSNTSIGSSGAGGLSTYTPSVLRTMDNFEPGMFRPPPPPVLPRAEGEVEKNAPTLQEEEENTQLPEEKKDPDMKPADPDLISSWSLSAGTSDLLF